MYIFSISGVVFVIVSIIVSLAFILLMTKAIIDDMSTTYSNNLLFCVNTNVSVGLTVIILYICVLLMTLSSIGMVFCRMVTAYV